MKAKVFGLSSFCLQELLLSLSAGSSSLTPTLLLQDHCLRGKWTRRRRRRRRKGREEERIGREEERKNGRGEDEMSVSPTHTAATHHHLTSTTFSHTNTDSQRSNE